MRTTYVISHMMRKGSMEVIHVTNKGCCLKCRPGNTRVIYKIQKTLMLVQIALNIIICDFKQEVYNAMCNAAPG